MNHCVQPGCTGVYEDGWCNVCGSPEPTAAPVAAAAAAGARAVDLSNDLRVPGPQTPEWARDAVYGLPELPGTRARVVLLPPEPGLFHLDQVLDLLRARPGVVILQLPVVPEV